MKRFFVPSMKVSTAVTALLLIQQVHAQLIRPIPPRPPIDPGRIVRPLPLASNDDQSKPDAAQASTTNVVLPIYFSNDQFGRMAYQHIQQMFKVDQNAERDYQTSLRSIRLQADKVIPALTAAYEKMTDKDVTKRWTVVETLREMAHPQSVKFLQDVALKPIPRLTSTDPEVDPIAGEVHLRATAIDGLATIAQKGNAQALETLKQLAKSEDITLKRRAVRGFLAAGNYQQQERILKTLLSARDHHLITLNVTNIKSVEHPQMPMTFPQPVGRNRTQPPTVR